jgi:hypothetical protein
MSPQTSISPPTWRPKRRKLLAVACVGTLLALALMTWQIFQPKAFPIIVAMSAGQVLGTASFLAFLYVVVTDLRAQRNAARSAVDLDDAVDVKREPGG